MGSNEGEKLVAETTAGQEWLQGRGGCRCRAIRVWGYKGVTYRHWWVTASSLSQANSLTERFPSIWIIWHCDWTHATVDIETSCEKIKCFTTTI